MILSYELDLVTVKMNHHVRYLGQRSKVKVIVRTHTHTSDGLHHLDLIVVSSNALWMTFGDQSLKFLLITAGIR